LLRGLLHIACLLFVSGLQLITFSGCIKEYSYEKPPVDSLPIDSIPDDTIAHTPTFSHCVACDGKDDFILNTWNFKVDTSFLCGNITRALRSPDRKGLTFFGPSACSLDTGLIMTVYLYDPLVADATNITAGYTVFQYYNNVGTQDIFDSFQLVPFTLIIDTYDSATAIAKGRFYGYVDTDRHGAAQIRDGKYAIHFDN